MLYPLELWEQIFTYYNTMYWPFLTGGGGGIRTHETLAGLIVFKTIALDRYATPPHTYLTDYIRKKLRAEHFAFINTNIDTNLRALAYSLGSLQA